MINMIVAALITPWQLAFVQEESLAWLVINTTVDVSFFIDIVITFFTAFFDEKHMTLITDKKIIACTYLKFWFWLDLISIVPFDRIFLEANKDFGTLAKFTRVGKLYKMFRMLRLIKMVRILKDRKKIISSLDSVLKVNAGLERLIIFFLGFVLLYHTTTCLWIMIT